MESLGLNEIREKFLEFFESKGHLRMKSFSLVPQNDKSLLIINSGMAPLKPYFTGQEIPPNKRVTTCQKCIRTGDIENVGKTARHGTFFEMLGNFSFGDYFKEEIIPWSWEFVTEVMKIPKENLYVSVYRDDDEAYDIWNKKMGLAPERIFRMGKEDNFWEVGLGPCGPCSEIYYDRGEKYGCGSPDCTVGCDCDRYMEFWNLVFTQFNKQEDGSYANLEHPNIDTGMGLERIAAMMQDVVSIFDVDTIMAIRKEVCRVAGVEYNVNPRHDESIRVITDHIRSVTFMTADGILPSNEGRGYVLRRLLRRAARHGKLLGIKGTFLTELSKVVIDVSKDAYPELIEKKDYIFKLISVEENRFYETIDQGMEILKNHIKTIKGALKHTLIGEEAFRLYDTYGFPLELMQEILEEEGLKVDIESFKSEMEKQRERGRAAREESTYMGADGTVYDKLDAGISSEFVGYDNLQLTGAVILAIITDNEISEQANDGVEVSIITDKTTLYAESGGQKGDRGIIKTDTGSAEIVDCIKVGLNKIAQIGKITEGFIKKGQKAEIITDNERRLQTARNHSATHLLQKALRDVLGSHVQQAGSYVSYDRLRFDFTHFSAMTAEEIRRVEEIVNNKIFDAMDIVSAETGIDEARVQGAMALFGEKYGDKVRMVNMGGYSIELCGGTHLKNTSQIGTFKIISENGVAAGVRRIEALSGKGALQYYKQMEDRINIISSFLKTTPDNMLKRVEYYINKANDLNKELDKFRSKIAGNLVDNILDSMEIIDGINTIAYQAGNLDMNGLRDMGDKLRDKIKSGIIILAGGKDDKQNLVAMVTDDIVKMGINAGAIIRAAAAVAGGSGGGRPNMAQAGIKDADKIKEALEKAKEVIKEQKK